MALGSYESGTLAPQAQFSRKCPRSVDYLRLSIEDVNALVPAHLFEYLRPNAHTNFAEMCFLEQQHIDP